MIPIQQPAQGQSALSQLGGIMNMGMGIAGIASGTNPVGGSVQLASGLSSRAPQSQPPMAQGQSTAMGRAMGGQSPAPSLNDTLNVLKSGEQALNTLPPDARQEFGPPLFQTMMNLKKDYPNGLGGASNGQPQFG